MEYTPQAVEPQLHTYERARLMLQVARPAFTRFSEETIAAEADAYKAIRIDTEDPQDLDIVAFGAGLGRYFKDEHFPLVQNLPVQKTAVSRLAGSCLGPMIESQAGSLVKFGVNDSLYFATIFSSVAALQISDLLKAQGNQTEPLDLLRRDDFQRTLEALSFAPFEMYNEKAVKWPRDSGRAIAESILKNHSVGEPTFADLVHISPEGTVTLDEFVKQRLMDAVRRQNANRFKSRTFAVAAADRHISTAGCPVGMHPNAKDGEKSAIAQWCEYVADQYERYQEHVDFGRKLRVVNAMLMMSGALNGAVKPQELHKPEFKIRIVSPGWKNETQVV